MNRRALYLGLSAYLAFWLGVGAVVTYLFVSAGRAWWLGALVAWFLFGFVNGSLAYWGKARQMRQRGEVPPPFLAYLLRPASSTGTIAVPKPIRVLLGILFLAAGAVFLALAAFLATAGQLTLVQRLVLVALFLPLGLGIGYVGWRLVVVKNDERLFRRIRMGTTP